jgi:hypothetical protein
MKKASRSESDERHSVCACDEHVFHGSPRVRGGLQATEGGVNSMLDILFLIVTASFFTLAIAGVKACERLK